MNWYIGMWFLVIWTQTVQLINQIINNFPFTLRQTKILLPVGKTALRFDGYLYISLACGVIKAHQPGRGTTKYLSHFLNGRPLDIRHSTRFILSYGRLLQTEFPCQFFLSHV